MTVEQQLSVSQPTRQMDSVSAAQLPWVKTPLQESKALSTAAGCKVYMKLDLLQPGGSFKSRGVGNMCLRSLQTSANPSFVHFFSSSGGNAGLAAATAARTLKRPATVVVPEATSELMRSKIRAAGAEVFVHGASWFEADSYLKELMKGNPNAVYCPPFDHEFVWEGNSTIVDEIVDQLPPNVEPSAIVLSVGGGGLLNGVLLGLQAHNWSHIPVVAVETLGADSLNSSIKSKQHITLPSITSRAVSLGARRISQKTWDLVNNREFDVRSCVLTDDEAMMGCWRLADDERLLVEDACGVSVATCYNGMLSEMVPELREDDVVVVIVCGGSNVTLDMLSRAKTAWQAQETPIMSKAGNKIHSGKQFHQLSLKAQILMNESQDPLVPSTHTLPV